MSTTQPEVASITPPTPKVEDALKEVKEKLTEEEKELFFKSFLSDKPFIGVETIFKGKIPLKFAALTIKQNNSVMLQMQYDREVGTAMTTDKYLIQVIQYKVAASLLEFNNTPFAQDITEETYPANAAEHTTYLLKRLKLMESWGVYKISSITEAFNRFENKLRALTEESFKENF